jgi:hypothetical protein
MARNSAKFRAYIDFISPGLEQKLFYRFYPPTGRWIKAVEQILSTPHAKIRVAIRLNLQTSREVAVAVACLR